MTQKNPFEKLSRRERQIMEILLELGEASAEDVRLRLPDPPSNSATRAMLAKLEGKGHVRHTARDLKYVYEPRISETAARRSAVSRLVDVFFGGSVGQAVSGMVNLSGDRLSEDELDQIASAIAEARRKRKGRGGRKR